MKKIETLLMLIVTLFIVAILFTMNAEARHEIPSELPASTDGYDTASMLAGARNTLVTIVTQCGQQNSAEMMIWDDASHTRYVVYIDCSNPRAAIYEPQPELDYPELPDPSQQ
jgi:hypothetical protein